MKKKDMNKKRSDKRFKIGDHGTIMADRRIIPIEVVDIDRAIEEYRCYPTQPGEMRIFWRKASEIRRAYG